MRLLFGKEEVDGSSPLNSSSINHIATPFTRDCERRYFYLKLRLRHLLRQTYKKINFIFSTPPVVGVGNSQTPLQWAEIASLDFFKGVAFHAPPSTTVRISDGVFLISPALFSFRMSRLLTSKFVMRWYFTILCFRLGSAVCPKNGRSNYFPVDNIHSYLI